MDTKIKVSARSQNRMALGMVHAYMLLNPKATLDDLRKAFPNNICPDAGVKELFRPVAQAETFNQRMSLYFAKDDEVLTLADGSKIAFAQVWSKTSLEKITAQAASYGIAAGAIDKAIAMPGFTFEYLNGFNPNKKKGCLGIMLLPLAIGTLTMLLI